MANANARQQQLQTTTTSATTTITTTTTATTTTYTKCAAAAIVFMQQLFASNSLTANCGLERALIPRAVCLYRWSSVVGKKQKQTITIYYSNGKAFNCMLRLITSLFAHQWIWLVNVCKPITLQSSWYVAREYYVKVERNVQVISTQLQGNIHELEYHNVTAVVMKRK